MRYSPDKVCGTLTPAEVAERNRVSGLLQSLDALADHPPIPTDAVCLRAPGLWWSSSPLEREAAAAMCRDLCPSLAECETLAYETRVTTGIWAGVDVDACPDRANPFDAPRPRAHEKDTA